MRKSLLKQMSWQDVQEIWWQTDQVLRSIPDEPEKWPEWAFNTSTRFGKALAILRDENDVPPPIEERYPIVLQAAEQATLWTLTDSRERQNTLIRSFVAYKLHGDGYSYTEIGKIMHRDHSTITHLAYRMRDMLSIPYAYKEEVAKYKEFEKLV